MIPAAQTYSYSKGHHDQHWIIWKGDSYDGFMRGDEDSVRAFVNWKNDKVRA